MSVRTHHTCVCICVMCGKCMYMEDNWMWIHAWSDVVKFKILRFKLELRTYLPVVTRGYNNERFSEPNYNDLTPLQGSGRLRYLHCAVAGGSAREVSVSTTLMDVDNVPFHRRLSTTSFIEINNATTTTVTKKIKLK